MCSSAAESVVHLFLAYSFAREIWREMASSSGFQEIQPAPTTTPIPDKYADWWSICRKDMQNSDRRRLNGVMFYSAWQIWNERNAMTNMERTECDDFQA